MPTSIEIADALREAILRGDYVADQRLIEIDLRERYNATRFVIRTALQVLSAEGLIEVRHNRGARVRSMSLAQAIEVCEIRRVLEGLCAARAAERATPADRAELKSLLQQMRASAKEGEVLRYNDLNATLHATIRRRRPPLPIPASGCPVASSGQPTRAGGRAFTTASWTHN